MMSGRIPNPASRFPRMACLAVFFLSWTGEASAKQTIDYVPPPYSTRFLVSLFTLFPLACLLAILSCFLVKRLTRAPRGFPVRRILLVATGCLLIGTTWAATDARNDEGWNPAMIGAFCLSFIAPFSLLVVPGSLSPGKRAAIAAVTFLVLFIPLQLLASEWELFGLRHGWPTAW